MNYNLILIKALLNKDTYNKYNSVIEDLIKDTTNEIQKIFYVVKDYYSNYNNNLLIDDLILKFYASYPAMRPKEKEAFDVLFDKIREIQVNEDLIDEYISGLKKVIISNKLAIAAVDYAAGKHTFDEVKKYFDDLESPPVSDEEDFVFVSDDLNELLNEQSLKHGLRWRLDSLNRSLGSLRKGDFGFVFARPETGKTTFLASECTYMASQALEAATGPVVWFNNEEQGSKVHIRCIQAFFGLTVGELRGSVNYYGQRYKDELQGHLKIVDEAQLHRSYVEKVVEKLNPSLIVFDQIDKIGGFQNDREDLKLGGIYQWARELAKCFAPTIGISQADASGEGKMWLTMDNVANAKTAKQAEADWILGIGFSHSPGMENTRYLHLSKNKLIGDDDSDPILRHGKWAVLIQPEIARYRDV